MYTPEKCMNLFRINTDVRKIRKQMLEALELVARGAQEDAIEVLDEADMEFARLKDEQEFLEEAIQESRHARELKNNIGFTEVFSEAVHMACTAKNRHCGAISFHIYN